MCCWRLSVSPRAWFRAGLLVALAVLVSGCGATRLAAYNIKEIAREPLAEGGVYKIGERYEVAGVWYSPRADPGYSQTGIASWYGRPFHGQRTANGEIYDMNAMTAAHKTLPMPSFVRVTNLENGRALILRVNDRGPFVNGRIIDVSRRAAQLLGFSEKGIARIHVQIVDGPSENLLAARAANPAGGFEIAVAAAPRPAVAVDALPPPPGIDAAPALEASNLAGLGFEPAVTLFEVAATELYIQAGAFAIYDSANSLRAGMEYLGRTSVSSINAEGRQLYRVRIGPIDSVPRADAILAVVIGLGHTEARIVIDG